MLASRIMQKLRRTTVAASNAALGTLEAEAARRGVPVSTLLREAIEEKARALRAGRRPRVGVARSVDGLGAADVAGEPIAEHPR
jgi:Ribbon-helix-helix protein, copG family